MADTSGWLRSLYTSELFFFLHLQAFISLEGKDITPSKSDPGHHKPTSWFQLFVFLSRVILNVAALACLFFDLSDSEIWSGSNLHDLRLVFNGTYALAGWSLLGVSFILYIMSYFHQKFHLSRFPIEFPVHMYWLAQISAVNFSFDLPAASVPTASITRFFVCLINLICIGIVCFVVFLEEQLVKAWGCYPQGTPLSGYKYGICPAFYGLEWTPVCTQPNIRCSEGASRGVQLQTATFHLACIILAVSFSIYVLSIQTKISWWQDVIFKKSL